MDDPTPAKSTERLTALSDSQRKTAMSRYGVLRPRLEDGATLAEAARCTGIPLRTAGRWLTRYRAEGLAGLAPQVRTDSGVRRLRPELVAFIEGLGLSRPRPSVTAIWRKTQRVAIDHGWPPPSYSTTRGILDALDPATVTLAHDGPVAFRDRFELVYRRDASRPNAVWQADHTELDLLILDQAGRAVRPWLTVVLDDCSRAVAGYTVFLGAPSALQTSLALRQAIWRKDNPAWMVCGIPDALYVDHGSDFTSDHLTQAAVDLHIELVYSGVGRPQGRGKVERFLETITTEWLPELPGHLVHGRPVTPPALSLPELDAAIGRFIVDTYHPRPHFRDTYRTAGSLAPGGLASPNARQPGGPRPPAGHGGQGPKRASRRHPLPRDPLSRPHPGCLRGRSVTIRYDPRDLAEIRVFHHDRFLCRAISPEHAAETVTLKDVQAARVARRRALRSVINERVATVGELLADRSHLSPPAPPPR